MSDYPGIPPGRELGISYLNEYSAQTSNGSYLGIDRTPYLAITAQTPRCTSSWHAYTCQHETRCECGLTERRPVQLDAGL